LSADAPVVVVFDDLQWTDPSTAELLHPRDSRRNCRVVAGYRPDSFRRDL
jgi:hypothetical protein